MNQPFLARCGTVVPVLLALACQGGYTQSSPPPAPAAATVAVEPVNAAVVEGGKQAFAATVTALSDTSVTWAVAEGAGAGSVTATGVYTAPATTGVFHVVATSVADPTRSGSASVTVQAPPPATVAIVPATASVSACTSRAFAATVTNAGPGVTWSVQEGAAGGTVDAAGKYTAPTTPGTYHLVATSQAAPTASATAVITVATQVLGVVVGPATTSATTNGTVTFTATVTTSCGQFTATQAFAQAP
jgi:hypothetical protein